MTDIATLKAQLEALRAKRASGSLRVKIGDREVWYRSDKEMRAAIESLQYEIDKLEGNPKKGFVVVNSEKGW